MPGQRVHDDVNGFRTYQASAADGNSDAATAPIFWGSASQVEPYSSSAVVSHSRYDVGCDPSSNDGGDNEYEGYCAGARAAWQQDSKDDIELYPKLSITADRREMHILLTLRSPTLCHQQMYGICTLRRVTCADGDAVFRMVPSKLWWPW